MTKTYTTANTSVSRRLPADFEQHMRTYLLWPHRADNWRNDAAYAQKMILDLANIVAKHEPVTIGVRSGTKFEVEGDLHSNITIERIEYDDIWVRDTGPLILFDNNQKTVAVDFKFNSWGGLLPTFKDDDEVALRIATLENLNTLKSNLILEGGAITTDGSGTVILTEESVISSSRNMNMSKSNIETELRDTLGVSQIIWIPKGLADDEAGGHIDNVCAFASPTNLLLADTEDESHPSYFRLKEAQKCLAGLKNTNGEKIDISFVPLPPHTVISASEANGFAPTSGGTMQRSAGTPLAPSYINFYIANKSVIVPTFGVEADEQALSIISSKFPGREVVPFLAREFVLGGGGIHCLTRNIFA